MFSDGYGGHTWPRLSRKHVLVVIIFLVIVFAARGLSGSDSDSGTSTPSHDDVCAQAQTKSSDPYVSDHDADRAIADCIDSLGGN